MRKNDYCSNAALSMEGPLRLGLKFAPIVELPFCFCKMKAFSEAGSVSIITERSRLKRDVYTTTPPIEGPSLFSRLLRDRDGHINTHEPCVAEQGCLGLSFFQVLTLGFAFGVQTIDTSLTSIPECSKIHSNLFTENNSEQHESAGTRGLHCENHCLTNQLLII